MFKVDPIFGVDLMFRVDPIFGVDLMATDQPSSASYDLMTEPRLEPATGELDGWMMVRSLRETSPHWPAERQVG